MSILPFVRPRRQGLTEAELDAAIAANRARREAQDWDEIVEHPDGPADSWRAPGQAEDDDASAPRPRGAVLGLDPLLLVIICAFVAVILLVLSSALGELLASLSAAAVAAVPVPVQTPARRAAAALAGERRSLLRLSGPLVRPAWTRVSAEGHAWLCVEISQGDGALPVRAAQLMGRGEQAQYVCHRTAGVLRTGSSVTVRARGIAATRDHLQLLDVLGVEFAAPRAWHESEREDVA